MRLSPVSMVLHLSSILLLWSIETIPLANKYCIVLLWSGIIVSKKYLVWRSLICQRWCSDGSNAISCIVIPKNRTRWRMRVSRCDKSKFNHYYVSHYCHNLVSVLVKSKHTVFFDAKNVKTVFVKLTPKMAVPFLQLHPCHLICFIKWMRLCQSLNLRLCQIGANSIK